MSASALPARARVGLLALAAACAVLLAGFSTAQPAAAANAAAWWHLSSSAIPTNLAPGSQGTIRASATNVGYANVLAAAGTPVKLIDRLPASMKITGARPVVCESTDTLEHVCAHKEPKSNTVATRPPCTTTEHEAVCTFEETLAPYEQWEMSLNVEVSAGAPSPSSSEVNEVLVQGGEVAEAKLREPVTINSAPTVFGVERFSLMPENANGGTETQAGAHPFQFSTGFTFNQEYHTFPEEKIAPTTPEVTKNLRLDLPAGFIGNANKQILHQCTELQFVTLLGNHQQNECSSETAIGVATVSIDEPLAAHLVTVSVPVFNLVPSKGEPARFGFLALNVPVLLDTVVTEGDYHVVVNVKNASQSIALLSSQVTIWGVPGDERHDVSRGYGCAARGASAIQGETCRPPTERITAPFLTLPTSCTEPLLATTRLQSWSPGAQFTAPLSSEAPETLENCAALPFTPTMTIAPEEHSANTPTGLNVALTVPQTTTLETGGLAESNVRDTTVTLPEGVQLNPSAANGLEACSLAQIGYEQPNPHSGTLEFNSNPVACPDASKVGTVGINSPDLENELTGSVYLAAENENPFNSLFGLYIAVEDPITGVLVKLAGRVTLDPTTGQITTDFPNAPQLAFSELKLHLFNGPRASISTPRSCGTFTPTASLTPWSTGQLVNESFTPQEFEVTSGPHGTPCASPQTFAPGFQAGTVNNQAGAFTPFSLSLTRPDTDQALQGVSVTLPPGLVGLLSSVVQCPEPQASQGTCGEASLIGRASAVTGLGSDPFTINGGRVYITGPYGGAPFGLSIVIPAVAGPFNFGNVVTRSTISVDPNTAALTINSTLPTMVNTDRYPGGVGVPVQLRRVDVTIERPGGAPFQFNPTNCTPTAITGTLTGDQGAHAPQSVPFQVTGCEKLPFAPKLTAFAAAQASKVNGVTFKVNVTSAGVGQANIRKVFLTIPKLLPSRLTTIQKACLLAVFNVNPAGCPEGSVIGKATIHTPVLTNPLSGPAYLVSHGSAGFPDIVFVLQGEGVTLILDGKTDIKNGVTYSRFETAPDAPFSTFETELPAGPHSALTAFVPPNEKYNLCKTKLVVPTEITAQNGDVIKQNTKVGLIGCKKTHAKSLTRAQLLGKALKKCKRLGKKSKRVACEKQARKKYGAKKKTKKKK